MVQKILVVDVDGTIIVSQKEDLEHQVSVLRSKTGFTDFHCFEVKIPAHNITGEQVFLTREHIISVDVLNFLRDFSSNPRNRLIFLTAWGETVRFLCDQLGISNYSLVIPNRNADQDDFMGFKTQPLLAAIHGLEIEDNMSITWLDDDMPSSDLDIMGVECHRVNGDTGLTREELLSL